MGWWIALGVCVVLHELIIVCSDDTNLDGNIIGSIPLLMITGAILAGKLIGGFGWVMNGLLIGGLVGGSMMIILQSNFNRSLSALLPFFAAAGAIFAYKYLGGRWWNIAIGASVGWIVCFLLNLPFINSGKARYLEYLDKNTEERKKEKAEARRKRLEKKEIERNRPIEEKLAELESWAQKAYQENSTKLNESEEDYTQIAAKYNQSPPQSLLEKYMNVEDGDAVFKESLKDAFVSSGVEAAKERVNNLGEIAKYYAATYRVSAYKAKLENDVYTANRKKALLFAERIKDIYEKLTPKQKERKIDDAAKVMNIGGLNVAIPNSVRSVDKLAGQLREIRSVRLEQSLGDFVREHDIFKKKAKLPNKEDVAGELILMAIDGIDMAIDGITSKYEDNKKLKEKLMRAQKRLFGKIKKMEEGRFQADSFSKRVGEINRALEGTIDAYGKMFVEIYNTLYPTDDASKSKEARAENKKNGGSYLNDEEETEAVIQLRTTGQFLLNLVDTKFEGDDDE